MFFKDTGKTNEWRISFNGLSLEDRKEALKIIYDADFKDVNNKTNNQAVLNVLKYYTNFRKDIITPGTELFKLKQEYDNFKK